jgi:hypothetical protein
VDNGDGTWTHSYSDEYVSVVRETLGWAYQNGLYVIVDGHHNCVEVDDNCPYFGYPEWLYQAPYNSHSRTYAKTMSGVLEAQTDFWSDELRQEFMMEMWKHVVLELKDLPGIIGYEVMNEPQEGTLPLETATTQLILDWQLEVAKTIRRLDPPRVVAFATRSGAGPGLPNADLSGWHGLGNVAFDLHDYYGARWGVGLNMNPASPGFGETRGILYNIVNGDSPYLGSVGSQVRWMQNRMAYLGGIPMYLGEAGDKEGDPGIFRFWGTALAAANHLNVSWAVNHGADSGFVNPDGSLKPWGWIVLDAVEG